MLHAVLDILPQSVLVGTDIPRLLEMLQTKSSTEEEKVEPLEKTLVVKTRSHTREQPTKETTESSIINDNVGSVLTEFNFDDEFYSHDKLTNPTQ